MARRPYLTRPGNRASQGPPPPSAPEGRLGLDKILANTTPVPIKTLLKMRLPEEMYREVIARLTDGGPTVPAQDLAEAVEAAALHNTVSRAPVAGAPPQNMFAPFGVGNDPLSPTHWANVDCGSMVNVVYSGVLRVFPELR